MQLSEIPLWKLAVGQIVQSTVTQNYGHITDINISTDPFSSMIRIEWNNTDFTQSYHYHQDYRNVVLISEPNQAD